MTSDKGRALNGRIGRILGITEGGRWEVLLDVASKGQSGRHVVNVKPGNLKAARRGEVINAWRRLPLTAHDRVRETARRMKAALPVTVLSGFLGAGKTTLLNHLLKNQSGHRIALIVNDMASVNIDAELVRRDGMMHKEEKMVELSNGCICCTLREDLLTSLSSLASEDRFDHVLIESSGISEPLPVAETFTFKDMASGVRLSDVASLHNLVTVVDAASIFEQLNTMDMLADRGWQADTGDERTVAQLLCDQLEFADVLVVNKTDLVSEAQLGAVEALLRRINPKAEVARTDHGQLEPALVLGAARFSMARAEAHPMWLKEAREHEHTPETVEYGISSFVYRAKRPFHPERLSAALPPGTGSIPRAGALRNLLRVKGFVWLAPWSSRQGIVALAGTQFTLVPGEPWLASIRREHWPKGVQNEVDRATWHEQHGDRATELVCIGKDLDAAAARAELDACLLTEGEMAAGPKAWFGLRDPFYEAWEAEQRRKEQEAARQSRASAAAGGGGGGGGGYGPDHGRLADVGAAPYVLVLHRKKTGESVELSRAVGVMGMAGIGADVALSLVTRVNETGRGIVAQGKEDDMRLLAGMFREVGMKTTVQAAGAAAARCAA